MNSIQLELFPQELLKIEINRRAGIICFDFEGRQGWASIWVTSRLKQLFRNIGVPNFEYIFRTPKVGEPPYHEFLCPVGTWKMLEVKTNFQFIYGVDLLVLKRRPGGPIW